MTMNRRTFTGTLALGLGAAALPAWAQGRKTLRVGHTGITWPYGQIGGGRGAAPAPAASVPGRQGADATLAPAPTGVRQIDPAAVETVFRDVASLGYHGLELFGWQVEAMEAHGGIGPLIEKYRLPLIGTYGGPNLTDPAQRRTSLERLIETAKLVKKYGGKVIVFGPNGVNRSSFVFADHKSNIITSLNEGARAIADLGLTPVLHQHTGTCVETRDETYAVMEAADTRYLKFGPDIGQLQKGGADPVAVVKDFLPLVHHLHLKDYSGGDAYLGYSPLGQGKVNLAAILDMVETRPMDGMTMVELDSSQNMPIQAAETARIARQYLEKQGVGFRS